MSLVAQYNLNGNAEDLVSGNDGVPTDVTWVDGKISQAGDFNGTTSNITLTENSGNTPIGSFSVSTWFNANIISDNDYIYLTGRDNSSGFRIYISGGFLRFACYVNGVRYNLSIGISASTWYHTVCSFDSENGMSLFLDGVLVDSNNVSGEVTYVEQYGNAPSIGSHGGVYHFDGLIDDFRIYDHALSEREAQENYKSLVLYKFQEENTNNAVTVPDSPTILGDTTIAFWLYPINADLRQTVWNKGYAGEGTINYEASFGGDQLRFYFGPNGNNGAGYESFDSTTVPPNQWTHAVVTRNMATQEIKWYINGSLNTTGSFSFTTIGETIFDLTIGSGYTNQFTGSMREVKQFATVLDATGVENLYKTGLAVDNSNRIHSNYLVESGIINPNELDYTTWEVGTTGNQSGFTANGGAGDNRIVSDTDPFGKTVLIWETTGPYDDDADGGWNGSYFNIDDSKLYRFAVWIRRTVQGNGSYYFGLNGGTLFRRDTGDGTTNPYFQAGGWVWPEGQWILFVAHCWPAGSGTGADKPTSGIYSVEGGRLGNINRDYVVQAGQTELRHRAYLYYVTDDTTEQQFCYPRVDLVDGTEPSIEALLSGFDSINFDRMNDELGSSSVPDTLGVKRENTNVGQFSEVGITRELISWFPLKGDAKDRVSNEVATVNGAVPTADGYEFDGVDDFIGTNLFSETDGLFNLESFSASFWLNLTNPAPDGRRLVIGREQFGGNYCAVENESNYIQFRTVGVSTIRFFPVLNQWYHLVVVRDSVEETNRLYVNGVLEGNINGSPSTSEQSEIRIGGGHTIGIGGDSSIDGEIAKVKFYSDALSPEEVAQEYSSSSKALINKSTAFAKEFIEV